MRSILGVVGLTASLLVSVIAVAGSAGAAGDPFIGVWSWGNGDTTTISMLSQGVYRMETVSPGYCTKGAWIGGDDAAVVVIDEIDGVMLSFDYTTTSCPGGPDPIGKMYLDRSLIIDGDTLIHGTPADRYQAELTRRTTEFFDVTLGQFYADPVTWLACERITTGTSATMFSPDATVTRGQMAAFLWRYAGEPDPDSLDTPFTDVPPGQFYSVAVAWLVEQEITTGTSPITFSPSDPVTRGQMAAFLWRYAGEPDPDSLDTPFTDVPPGQFYSVAVAWLVEQEITTGTSPITFSPDDPVTRGQMAAFLWRLAGEGDCGGIPDGTQGFLITKATADEYGITHIDQLNDDPAINMLFDSDLDGKAEIYGCQSNWMCDNIIDSIIAFNGWDKIEQTISGYDAMFAVALAKVYAGEPMVMYVWMPSDYVAIDQMLPGHNVVFLSSEDVLDDSNPLGDPGGEDYDQRPGLAPMASAICPGAMDGVCQLGWGNFLD